jgi:hypothetical protein
MKRICLIYLLLTWFFSNCFADNWTINTIDYKIGGAPSIAVDSNNSPLVVHPRQMSGPLFLLKPANGYDGNEILNTYNSTAQVLKVTTNSELVLAFLDTSNKKIMYCSKGSWFDWTFSEVALSDSLGIDMALSENDIPHIAYIRIVNGIFKVFHSWFDVQSSSWKHESLDGFGQIVINHPPDIAAAPDGKLIISCTDYGMEGSQMRVAVFSDGYWNYLPPIQNFSPPNACFTPDGKPATAYIKNEFLYYAVYINDIIGWYETAICQAHPADPPKEICLAHSSTGIPGIAYVINNHELMYATNVAGLWTTVRIDQSGLLPDLLFDHNDKPLIVYISSDACIGRVILKLAGIGLEGFNIADLNNDKIVNFSDFAILAEHWMTALPGPDKTVGDFDQNAKVDASDLRWLSCYWLNYAGH